MSKKSENKIKNELQEITPFEILKSQVYPVINQIILKVIVPINSL